MNRNVSSSFSRPLRGYVAGLALALAGGASLTAWADHPPGGPGPHRGGGHGAGMMWDSPRQIERLLDGVDATDAQRTQIRQIAKAAGEDMKAQRQNGRALREQQIALFTQPTVDANAVESLRQKMLAEHDAASKRITQAMLDISRVLTPEQRTQMATRLQARRDLMERQQRERRALDKNVTG